MNIYAYVVLGLGLSFFAMLGVVLCLVAEMRYEHHMWEDTPKKTDAEFIQRCRIAHQHGRYLLQHALPDEHLGGTTS